MSSRIAVYALLMGVQLMSLDTVKEIFFARLIRHEFASKYNILRALTFAK